MANTIFYHMACTDLLSSDCLLARLLCFELIFVTIKPVPVSQAENPSLSLELVLCSGRPPDTPYPPVGYDVSNLLLRQRIDCCSLNNVSVLPNNTAYSAKKPFNRMGAFIREFKTTNELLLKERNNSLSELEFEEDNKSKSIGDTNDINKEPPVLHHDKLVEPNEVLVETKPQEMKEQTVRPPTPLIPFPHGLKKEKEEAQQRKFLENLKQLHINIPFIEALSQMPKCSAVLLNKLPSKEKDPGSFTIPCDIGHLHINNALADLGASISLMPYTMYEKLGLGEPKLTRMSLELADRSIKYLRGIAENVLIKIDKFILPIYFVILDTREDYRISIILGRPFLATARTMIDVFNKKITLRVGNEEVIFDVDQSIKRSPAEDDECYGIDYLDITIHSKTHELLEDDQLDPCMVNNLEKIIDQSDLESCGKTDNGFESETPIRRIKQVNTPYSESQETKGPDKTQNEHLYSANTNEINEKRP
ncbi:DNA-directed DNA polymerase [Tanacetum coccineum]|uniref:DNA-directed DNA polymerase n=1 Tax=Tanacetum coccineum TaxID=301880 RepID=A0ABQ5AW47_9ASTR